MTEQYERAIADLDAAIALDPDYDSAFYVRGFAYQSIGDCDRANADWNKAIEIDPINEEALMWEDLTC